MKKIALDLDGVVFDSENLYRVYTEIYDTDVNKKDTIGVKRNLINFIMIMRKIF